MAKQHKIKIKKGDLVKVIAGEDRTKGTIGRVLEVNKITNRAIVEGANMIIKHQKPDAQNPDGGRVEKEAPIHISNLMLIDPKNNEPTRVGRKVEGGKIKRYSKKSETVVPALREQFNYKSSMQTPKLLKICINQGIGQATSDKKLIDVAINEMTSIVGQLCVPTKAKKSVSNFKLREGMPIGVRVTLRGERMWEFLDRLISVALPRVRDFRGINDKSFDGRGNYSLGIQEQIIFPEINLDKVPRITGMDITFVTSAGTDNEAYSLLSNLGLPFKNAYKQK
ncbi:UNVERIFIED_CONTAM: hypothetical protein GTU68_063294 [Idotea baltica]|nr:hypothetical protein [Idotea baltica]